MAKMKTLSKWTNTALLGVAQLATLGMVNSAQAADLITAYQDAVKYDSSLAASRASLMAEREGEVQARSGLLPTVNLSASLQHLDLNSDLGDDSYRTAAFGLSLAQPVFRAQNWFTFQASQENTRIAETQFSIAQQQLILDVATAYFNVLKAQETLRTTQAAEAAFKRQWEQAKERFDVGLIAITEVHEAKANYDATKTGRIQAQGALDIARDTLGRLSGATYEQINDLKAALPIQEPSPSSADAWVKSATTNNLSIQANQFAVEAQQLQLKTAQSGHLPTVDLIASYGNNHYTGRSPADDSLGSASLTLDFNMPLYAGGRTESGVSQARYKLEELELNLETARRNVKLNTTSLYRTIVTDIETVASQKQNIVSRESALEATKAGYNVGTRNIVEVLDAERSYYIALAEYATARYDYVIDTLKLKQTAGSLSPQDLIDLNQWLEAR